MSEKTKIKLRVGTVVAGATTAPGPRGMQTRYPFVEALVKLCGDPMPVRERYAAGRTLEEVRGIVKAYEDARGDLIKKHGRLNSEILREKIAEDESRLMAAKASVKDVVERRLEQMRKQLADIAKSPATDGHTILVEDEAAMAAFNEDVLAAEAEEVELAYLDHLLPISTRDGAESRLTGDEMMALAPVATLET